MTNKPTIVFFILFTICASKAVAQADSVKTYLINTLDMMKAKSVNKKKINWDSVYTNATGRAGKVSTIRATYPIIKTALRGLNDAHSDFYPPEVVKTYLLGYRATGQAFPQIKSEMLQGKYAYIAVPGIACYNYNEWDEFVNTFYAKLSALQAQNPKGWILDLRDNEGGMFYPMFAAISPFVDRKDVIGTVDPEGRYTYFNYSNGELAEGKDQPHKFKLNSSVPAKIKVPLVVLINKSTASSGEFCAISFVGQKNTTIIGCNTQGLTSGNQEYKLADGAFLKLTVGNTVDRNKKEYNKIGEGLTPTIEIKQGETQAASDAAYMTKAVEIINAKRIK